MLALLVSLVLVRSLRKQRYEAVLVAVLAVMLPTVTAFLGILAVYGPAAARH